MATYSEIVELRETVRDNVLGLVEAIKVQHQFENNRTVELRENASLEARRFLSEFGEKKVLLLFQTLNTLSKLIFIDFHPPQIVKIEPGCGPNLVDESNISCGILSAFIPEVPTEVMSRLHRQNMFANR